MQQLGKLRRDAVAHWKSVPSHRLVEYLLIAAYSVVAILAMIIGLTARTGTWFARAVANSDLPARPELKAIMKQLMVATADLSAGASLLVIAALIVYLGRRGKGARRDEMPTPLPSGPPFLL
jgi:hypothetical protein